MEIPEAQGLERMCHPAPWQALKRRREALERLVVETCACGLSTRDIEDALAELAGEGCPPSWLHRESHRRSEATGLEAEHIGCGFHKMWNVLDKDTAGGAAPAQALPGCDSGCAGCGAGSPAGGGGGEAVVRPAVPLGHASLQEDLEASLPHLVLPAAHLEHVGTTNPVERNFEKKRRLHKVLSRFPSDREYLKLVFAVVGGPANAGGGCSSARTSRGSDSGQ